MCYVLITEQPLRRIGCCVSATAIVVKKYDTDHDHTATTATRVLVYRGPVFDDDNQHHGFTQ